MAIDDLALMLVDPLSQRLFDLISRLSLCFLDCTIDDVFNPELRMRILDTRFRLKIRDWFLLATTCCIQLFLDDFDHIWC